MDKNMGPRNATIFDLTTRVEKGSAQVEHEKSTGFEIRKGGNGFLRSASLMKVNKQKRRLQ